MSLSVQKCFPVIKCELCEHVYTYIVLNECLSPLAEPPGVTITEVFMSVSNMTETVTSVVVLSVGDSQVSNADMCTKSLLSKGR